jgi:AcrR family transcriptional regulator
MTARAEKTRATGERIVQAALECYFELWLDEITLEEVARRAGVTSKTLYRRYGNRDGLLTAVSQSLAGAVADQRFSVTPGDVSAAVENLMEHYEAQGRLGLRNMAQAQRSELVAGLVAYGRDEHERWVAHAFGPFLTEPKEVAELLRAQLIAITDVTVWDVLRNQIGLSRERTTAAITGIVHALIPGASQ